MLKLFIEHCKSFGAGLSPISVQANPFNTQAALIKYTTAATLSTEEKLGTWTCTFVSPIIGTHFSRLISG